ncbi:MAG TPA: isoprenylcysteine carboxylmethyltransferase family protein [Candidatus Limnocylindrales bacterium]|jgi:protein-S-isoprenylcysteine O-methyltransferase Ste14
MGIAAAGSGGRQAAEARLPPLGTRGEGWIGLQMLLEIGALVVAPLTGPAIAGWPRTVLGVTGTVVMVAGVLVFAWGAAHLGHSFSVWVVPRRAARLVTSGPYRYSRHPVCSAQVLLVAGWALACASLVALLLVPVVAWYLDRYKLAREEQTLLAAYPAYRTYMTEVTHRMLPARPRPSTTVAPGA